MLLPGNVDRGAVAPQIEESTSTPSIAACDGLEGSTLGKGDFHKKPDTDDEDAADVVMPRVEFSNVLHHAGVHRRRAEDKAALGGMRNPQRAVGWIPQMQATSRRVHQVREPSCRQSPSDKPSDKDTSDKDIDTLQQALTSPAEMPCDPDLDVRTKVDAVCLEAWRGRAGDPDYEIA